MNAMIIEYTRRDARPTVERSDSNAYSPEN